MKILKSQDGYAIVVALCVLVTLTLIGTSAIQTSTTELQIASNHQIYQMNFYAAESGAPLAMVDLLNPGFLSEDDYENPNWLGTRTMELPNGTQFTYEVTHQVDNDGNVLRYGDENGDHIWEINTVVGRPLEIVRTHGTHKGRGGNAEIEVRLQFSPPFITPETALWVEDPNSVDFKGNASVIGDSSDPSVCDDVPDVLHHLDPVGSMDEPKHYGAAFVHQPSGGMYPFSLVKNSLGKKADYVGSTFPGDLAENSSIDNPVIIIINGDLHLNDKDLKSPATGILYVDGDLQINGNVEWNGLIISTGNASIGNGTAVINGSLVTGETAEVEITGNIEIQYDCKVMKDLFEALAHYRVTSWRQI